MRTSALTQLTAILLIAGTFSSADAQRTRTREQTYYAVPGISMRIYPPPGRIYHFGGTTIYQGRYSNPWPYGAPNGYVWPYAAPNGYVWPYGSTVITPPRTDRKWRPCPRNRG